MNTPSPNSLLASLKGQLTWRSVVVGGIGCIAITAASLYIALKMGALPWPIVFAALVSLFFLRAMGSRSLNEANVTHTIMSAGAMVAGGLAFTIPGIWIIGAGETSFSQMLLVALAGVLLGLVASALFRRKFVGPAECDEQAPLARDEGGKGGPSAAGAQPPRGLEFPIGQAAAKALEAGNAGGRVGAKLFGALAASAVWAALRDMLQVIPSRVLTGVPLPGVSFGISLSPLMLSVGFLVGTGAMVAWMAGGVVQLLTVSGTSLLGILPVEEASALNSSLGMGVMIGCGLAVVAKDILWKAVRSGTSSPGPALGGKAAARPWRLPRFLALGAAAIAFALCLVLGIGPAASVLVVLFAFATVAMAAQSAGQTGIDPMEIFGLIVLLIVAVIGDTPLVPLFFVAAIIAVACGLGGDVMNDFKAGQMLGTNPNAQLAGQVIGGLLGAVVAAATLSLLFQAYGPQAFGVGHEFVAAQANVVATLVGGVPNVPAFATGIALGFGLYLLGAPSMMVGLGIYLPFYMTFTAFLGCVVKWVIDGIQRRRLSDLPTEERKKRQADWEQTGLVIASGLLGGESVVGVLCAFLIPFL